MKGNDRTQSQETDTEMLITQAFNLAELGYSVEEVGKALHDAAKLFPSDKERVERIKVNPSLSRRQKKRLIRMIKE